MIDDQGRDREAPGLCAIVASKSPIRPPAFSPGGAWRTMGVGAISLAALELSPWESAPAGEPGPDPGEPQGTGHGPGLELQIPPATPLGPSLQHLMARLAGLAESGTGPAG